jgi:hypothetical protein
VPVEQETKAIPEAVGIFHRSEELQAAIDELLSSGFHRSELSLLAGALTVEEKLGHLYKGVSPLADDPAVPRSAYVSPEAIGDAEGGLIGGLVYVGAAVAAGVVVASGGSLAAIITAVVLAGGTGGFLAQCLQPGSATIMRVTFKSKLSAEDCCCGCGQGRSPMKSEH